MKFTPKVSSNTLLLIAAAVVFGVVVGLVVRSLFLSGSGHKENFADKTIVNFYSMEGCPHCVKFQGEWDKFASSASAAGIVANQVDSNDPSKPADIRGFPTITIQKGSDPYTIYKGDRTADALMSACK